MDSLASVPCRIPRAGVGACRNPVQMTVAGAAGLRSLTCWVAEVAGPNGLVAYCWGVGEELGWAAKTEKRGEGVVQLLKNREMNIDNQPRMQ